MRADFETLTKVCKRCEDIKHVDCFDKSCNRTVDGLRTICKQCYREKRKTSKREVSESERKCNLMKRYGLSIDDYDNMMKEQEGKCGCCKEEFNREEYRGIHIHHDHESGQVIGIWCKNCNMAEGFIKTLDRAKSLYDYFTWKYNYFTWKSSLS
jgi:hypothetical protein